jgi:hypothetical protein
VQLDVAYSEISRIINYMSNTITPIAPIIPQHIQNISTITPSSQDSFWCSHCDQVMVDSPDKGSLFRVFGHVKESGGYGSYDPVFFAVCSECSKTPQG